MLLIIGTHGVKKKVHEKKTHALEISWVLPANGDLTLVQKLFY